MNHSNSLARYSNMADTVEVVAFEEWKAAFDRAKASKWTRRAKSRKGSDAYNPACEVPPDLPWYRLDRGEIDRKIHDITGEVIKALATARKEDRT
jgi:hypothetical protein